MIKPTLILTLITTVIAGLLIAVNANLPYDPNKLSEAYLEKCAELLGDGEFIAVNWEEAGFKTEQPEEIARIIAKVDSEGGYSGDIENIAFEVITDGYQKDGLKTLVALAYIQDDEKKLSIKGLRVVASTETPGLGSKVENPKFLEKFNGVSTEVNINKDVEAVTGATRSSEGIVRAVNAVINFIRGEYGDT